MREMLRGTPDQHHVRSRFGSHAPDPQSQEDGTLNKHAISWLTLSSYRPLEAHLWCLVVQAGAKTQPVFRLYWNHYACNGTPREAERLPGEDRLTVSQPRLVMTCFMRV